MRFTAALALVVCLVLAAQNAAAQGSTAKLASPVIAIVDVQRILQESLAAKSVQQQLEAQRAKFQTEISKEETELRNAEQSLAQARETEKSEAYAEKEQQLRQRFLVVEKHVQARRKALDQAFADSMNAVRKSLLSVVEATAHDHGATLVLVKQEVLWGEKNLDMTDEILAKLNKQLPKVPVKISAEEARD